MQMFTEHYIIAKTWKQSMYNIKLIVIKIMIYQHGGLSSYLKKIT